MIHRFERIVAAELGFEDVIRAAKSWDLISNFCKNYAYKKIHDPKVNCRPEKFSVLFIFFSQRMSQGTVFKI